MQFKQSIRLAQQDLAELETCSALYSSLSLLAVDGKLSVSCMAALETQFFKHVLTSGQSNLAELGN